MTVNPSLYVPSPKTPDAGIIPWKLKITKYYPLINRILGADIRVAPSSEQGCDVGTEHRGHGWRPAGGEPQGLLGANSQGSNSPHSDIAQRRPPVRGCRSCLVS